MNWEILSTTNDTIKNIPVITKKLSGLVDISSVCRYQYITINRKSYLIPVILKIKLIGIDMSEF